MERRTRVMGGQACKRGSESFCSGEAQGLLGWGDGVGPYV